MYRIGFGCQLGGAVYRWPMVRFSSVGAVLVAAVATWGCGSKDAVTLGAKVRNVQISVEQKTLGTQLGGGFELFLEVGAEASGGSTVTLETFGLVRGGDTLDSPLQATPQGVTFPLTVGKGQSKTVSFVIDSASLLDPATKDAICAGPVRVSGSIKDTLSGGERTPLSSSDVTPSGC